MKRSDLDYIDWDIGNVTVINLTGRITLGQGTQRLREAIEDVVGRGRIQILVNLDEVLYIDSSGLGELVAAYRSVKRLGGVVKLMKLKQLTRDLIQVTHLCQVFEVFADEASAIESFKSSTEGPSVPPRE